MPNDGGPVDAQLLGSGADGAQASDRVRSSDLAPVVHWLLSLMYIHDAG